MKAANRMIGANRTKQQLLLMPTASEAEMMRATITIRTTAGAEESGQRRATNVAGRELNAILLVRLERNQNAFKLN